jgi:hypothetical protein
MKYLGPLLLSLAACGGRSDSLVPVDGYAVDYMLHDDDQFLYVVTTDIRLDAPSSTLPSGRSYEARATATSLWLFDEEFSLAEGRLFCVTTVVDPPQVSQLDTALPKVEGDTSDALAMILANGDVKACLGR